MARRFHLERDEDVTGVSGEGHIAEGVQFATGMAAMAWLTAWHSIAIYPDMEHLERIHGHEGKTRIVWDDPE